MWGAIFGLLKFIPGLASKFFDWQVKKMNVELEGFSTGAAEDTERYMAYLAASVEMNRMKMAQNSWWGAKLIIMIAGLPAAIHFGAVMLDSVPFPTLAFWEIASHPVGSWGIPRLPPPYDGYQWAIVQSFFLVMPAMTLVQATSQWLNRRR
jgi:hypothetical protein